MAKADSETKLKTRPRNEQLLEEVGSCGRRLWAWGMWEGSLSHLVAALFFGAMFRSPGLCLPAGLGP